MNDPVAIHEHRARAYLRDAHRANDNEDRTRYLASAVENSVALVESVLEQSIDQQAKAKAREHARAIPHWGLLKDIRVHNFHRRPLPGPESVQFYLAGPVQLGTGTTGTISIWLDERGPFVKGDNGGVAKLNVGGSARVVTIREGKFWDLDAEVWVELTAAIEAFLAAVPDFIGSTASLVRR